MAAAPAPTGRWSWLRATWGRPSCRSACTYSHAASSNHVRVDDDVPVQKEDLAVDKGNVCVSKALRPERWHGYIPGMKSWARRRGRTGTGRPALRRAIKHLRTWPGVPRGVHLSVTESTYLVQLSFITDRYGVPKQGWISAWWYRTPKSFLRHSELLPSALGRITLRSSSSCTFSDVHILDGLPLLGPDDDTIGIIEDERLRVTVRVE